MFHEYGCSVRSLRAVWNVIANLHDLWPSCTESTLCLFQNVCSVESVVFCEGKCLPVVLRVTSKMFATWVQIVD